MLQLQHLLPLSSLACNGRLVSLFVQRFSTCAMDPLEQAKKAAAFAAVNDHVKVGLREFGRINVMSAAAVCVRTSR